MDPIDEIKSRTTDYETRERWLQARVKGLGSSDAAAVLRQSRFSTPWKVWADKLSLLEPMPEDKEWLRMGHLMEPVIANWYFEETGRKVYDLGDYAITKSLAHDWQVATVDRLDRGVADCGVAEFKCVGSISCDMWRKDVPLEYQIQGQHQLAVTGLDRITFVCLFGSPTIHFRYFDLLRNDRFISAMTRREESFWNNFVLTGKAPEAGGMKPDTEAMKRYKVKAGACELMPHIAELDTRREELVGKLADLKEEKDSIDNRIKSAMGTADEAFSGETLLYSWKPNKNGTRQFRRVNKSSDEGAL